MYSINEVREYFRHTLHTLHPTYFMWGNFTSLGTILDCALRQAIPYMHSFVVCESRHKLDITLMHKPCLDTQMSCTQVQSMQSWLLEGAPGAPVCSSYVDCGRLLLRKIEFVHTPALLCFEIHETPLTVIDWVLTVRSPENVWTYDLIGLVYYGSSHFVACFVDRHVVLWF